MQYVNVKAMADEILEQVAAIPNKTKALLILYAGDDPASASYMKGKLRDCERCGIPCYQIKCESEENLRYNICIANMDQSIGGIIVQLPLPEGWDESLANLVDPEKDVDGFVHGSRFKPCTPEGIVYIMKKELGENLAGQDVVLVGKGELVGKPLIPMLLNEGCTLTICHSRTEDLRDVLRTTIHRVVIAAAGKPELVNLTWCLDDNLVIDAGISRVDGHLAGDCINFKPDVCPWVHVTPVPGGVGLMTRAMLMRHMMEVQDG